MPCQPAARTRKPLSHRLKQDSRAVKPLDSQAHNPKIAVEAQVCVWGCHVNHRGDPHLKSLTLTLDTHIAYVALSILHLNCETAVIHAYLV